MAIDTATKRFSIMGVGTLRRLQVPDGTIDQGDRQNLVKEKTYSGILFSSPAVSDGMTYVSRCKAAR